MVSQNERLQDFCADGARWKEEMIGVSESVKVRVISFEPPEPSAKPPVVFVAGWITLMAAWKDVLREMTKDFTVVYVETREKISSVVSGRVPFTVDALGRDIVSLIGRFGLKQGEYVLFGSSLGATVLLDCVRFLDRKPKCLVVVGPNAVFRIPSGWMIVVRLFYPPLYFLMKPVIKWYLRNFRLDVKSDYAQYRKYCDNLDAADPWKLKKAALAFSSYAVWDLLPGLNLPVLLIGASKDKLHEPENLRRMARLLPECTELDFETNKGTHSPEMVEAVRKYLAGI
jgi:pimeloyl-ACP methyl ester carboxylesterase